jgi:dolichol-phosphate mannosyltransferase
MVGYEYELIVIDDNSPDGTSDLIRARFDGVENRTLVTRLANHGLVNSINEGLSRSNGSICVWMDADMSMSPRLIPVMLEKIEDGADLVVGSRYIPGGAVKGSDPTEEFSWSKVGVALNRSEDSLLSAVISKWGNKVIKRILSSQLNDFSSGYFVAKKEILKTPALIGGIVDYCIRFTAEVEQSGCQVVEVPMVLIPRKTGNSKTSSSIGSILGIATKCFLTAFKMRLDYGRIARKR